MLNQIVDILLEDNPWHSKLGRFPKGGHRNAKMWSLHGERHGVKLEKGGKVRFRKFSKKQVAKIREWRRKLGPHPRIKGSGNPPYRAKKK